MSDKNSEYPLGFANGMILGFIAGSLFASKKRIVVSAPRKRRKLKNPASRLQKKANG